MCTPQGIIEHLGCMVFDEAVKAVSKAGKYVRLSLQDKLGQFAKGK